MNVCQRLIIWKLRTVLEKINTIKGLTLSFRMDEIEYIEKKYYNEIFALIDKCSNSKDQVINRNYKQFKLEFDFKSNVINRGIRAVVLSGTLMAISIFIIPFVQYLIKLLPLGIFITILIVVFSCYAIYLIADVVIQAIQRL